RRPSGPSATASLPRIRAPTRGVRHQNRSAIATAGHDSAVEAVFFLRVGIYTRPGLHLWLGPKYGHVPPWPPRLVRGHRPRLSQHRPRGGWRLSVTALRGRPGSGAEYLEAFMRIITNSDKDFRRQRLGRILRIAGVTAVLAFFALSAVTADAQS